MLGLLSGLSGLAGAPAVGFGCIVASEIWVPILLYSESGIKWMGGSSKRQCDNATEP
jgi:hypothetical protein